MSSLAVRTRDLSKIYKIFPTPTSRIVEGLSRGRVRRHLPIEALRSMNLDVPKGSTLGIVGSNGAGKSTLLKILAGTTVPTSGSFEIDGRVASLLELGTGFHMEFTGRQNIFLNATMMGISREEVRKRLDEIIEFSELGEFIDAPVRTYSAGMTMRLGFSVATAVDPDVLIIDEILAVGDMHFQKKCIDRIFRFRERGKSILFCSHSLYDVRQICDEVIWIRDGREEMKGDPLEVTHAYANYERSRTISENVVTEGVEKALPALSGGPVIDAVTPVEVGTENAVQRIRMGGPLDILVDYTIPEGGTQPFHLGVALFRSDNIPVVTMATHLSDTNVLDEGAGSYRARLHVDSVDLIQGEFYLQGYATDLEAAHLFHQLLDPRPLVVEQRTREVGLFLMDHEWSIRELDPSELSVSEEDRGSSRE